MLFQQLQKKYKNAVTRYRSRVVLKPCLTSLECTQTIGRAIQEKKPYLVARMGWLESFCIGTFLSEGKTESSLREKLELHAGVYPPTVEQLALFSDEYLKAIQNADMLGLMQSPFEGWLIKSYASQVRRVGLSDLEPYFHQDPWSQYLEGMKVLVVHPFQQSILNQYANVREKLFVDSRVLPQFELKVIKSPQTIAGNLREYDSWKTTLQMTEKQVEKENFDVAILGCGAYGLPLGAAIKKMGKVAIHLGGATQMLFGLVGERWKNRPEFHRFINDAWSPPVVEERPVHYKKIEGGAYW